jgi:hypothetical protein
MTLHASVALLVVLAGTPGRALGQAVATAASATTLRSPGVSP